MVSAKKAKEAVEFVLNTVDAGPGTKAPELWAIAFSIRSDIRSLTAERAELAESAQRELADFSARQANDPFANFGFNDPTQTVLRLRDVSTQLEQVIQRAVDFQEISAII